MERNLKRLFAAKPIGNWAMRCLLQLDEAWPGLLREATLASDLRRQVIFHVLAVSLGEAATAARAAALAAVLGEAADGLTPQQVIAKAVLDLKGEAIFSALYGDAKGLVGVHSRLGREPLQIAHYQAIVRLLAPSADRARARVFMQIEGPTGDLIEVVEAIPSALLHPRIVSLIGTKERLLGVLSTIDAIRAMNPAVSERDIALSLQRLESRKALRGWARRWLTKGLHVHRPDLSADPRFRVLGSGDDLAAAARRFENCLRGHAFEAALGRCAFAEYLPRPAIVQLIALSEGRWLIEGVFGPKNASVEKTALREIIGGLTRLGILAPRGVIDGHRFRPAIDLVGGSFLGFGLGGLDRDTLALDEWEPIEDEDFCFTNVA